MNKSLRTNLIILFLVAAIIFLVIIVYADSHSILNAFKNFRWLLLPILLLLSLGNYFVRFLKWEYYLRLLGIRIPTKQSIKIFFSGLSMSASPVKMGEILKSVLLKDIYQEPISKTASIIFAERLTDFLSITFLTITGFVFFSYSAVWVYFVLLFFLSLIILISNRKLIELLFKIFNKLTFMSMISNKVINLYESAYVLLRPKPLLVMLLVSIFSWFFECFAFYLVVNEFDLSISILFATFAYAFSSIAGAVSMLPGGLGVTEGSLSIILINSGVTKEIAITSTIIIRAVTLWFAVSLGSAVLFMFQRQIKNKGILTITDK